MTHTHESLCLTSEVFIVYNNRVLLRKHDKYKIWLSVGGHIEPGEDPNQAAIREAKEEVGLEVILQGKYDNQQELIPPRFVNRHRVDNAHEHFTFVYLARSKTDKIINSGREKSDCCKWFTIDDLDLAEYGIKDDIKLYAKTALKELLE